MEQAEEVFDELVEEESEESDDDLDESEEVVDELATEEPDDPQILAQAQFLKKKPKSLSQAQESPQKAVEYAQSFQKDLHQKKRDQQKKDAELEEIRKSLTLKPKSNGKAEQQKKEGEMELEELRKKNLILTSKLHGCTNAAPKTQMQINAENKDRLDNMSQKLDLVIEKLESIVKM